MLLLGEALSTGKPGGELLGDLKLGESLVKTGAGGDVGEYPILAKILGSAGSLAWAAIAALIAILLAS